MKCSLLQGIADKHDYIKVILTGAGTSAYVGDTLVPYFKGVYDEHHGTQCYCDNEYRCNLQTYLKKM